MSSKRWQSPLHLSPGPSPWLFRAVALPHCLGAVVLAGLGLPPPLLLALVLALDVSFLGFLCRHHWRCTPKAVDALTWDSGGDWHITWGDADQTGARLLPSSVVHPWLVLLDLRLEESGKRVFVPVMRDSVPPEVHRRLRVRLRTQFHRGDPSRT